MTTRAVAHELNVNFSTISHLQRHFREFGNTSNRLQPQTTCNHTSPGPPHPAFSSPMIIWDQPPGQLRQQLVCITKEFSRICTQFLEAENIPVLAWPAYSLDMSPIEHVWDALDRHIRQRVPVPANILQLHIAIEEEWTNIPQPQSTTWSTLWEGDVLHYVRKWRSHQILTGFWKNGTMYICML